MSNEFKGYTGGKDVEIGTKRSKNYMFVLNNPQFWLGTEDPEQIKAIMEKKFAHYRYVFQLERGEKESTLHLQGCILNDDPISATSIFNKFRKEKDGKEHSGIHLEVVKKVQAVYSYSTKDHTRVAGPFFHEYTNKTNEDGLPITFKDIVDIDLSWDDYKSAADETRPGARRKDMKLLYCSMVKEGMSLVDIDADLELSIIAGMYPSYAQRLNDYPSQQKFKKYRSEVRDIEITWLYGEPGSGKTFHAFELAGGYDKAYKISDYKNNPWDNYTGQDTVIFDEFYGDVRFGELMQLWDKYPLQLSARYQNKWACYTHVYVCSNLAPWDMYKNLDKREFRIAGLYRRITKLIHVTVDEDGTRSYEDQTSELQGLMNPEDEESYEVFG